VARIERNAPEEFFRRGDQYIEFQKMNFRANCTSRSGAATPP
jgi:hypothetical protein